jgi:hypothetical protein
MNQLIGLGIGLGAALFPVLKRTVIGSEVIGENRARQVEFMPQCNQLLGRKFGNRTSLKLMGA